MPQAEMREQKVLVFSDVAQWSWWQADQIEFRSSQKLLPVSEGRGRFGVMLTLLLFHPEA
jgi:hypothetical protein